MQQGFDMHTQITRLTATLFLGASLLLTGCGEREPSEADLRTLVEQGLTSANEAMSGLAGLTGGDTSGLQTTLDELKKVSCKEVPDRVSPTFECEVQMTLTLPLIGRQSGTEIITLSKASNGWIQR